MKTIYEAKNFIKNNLGKNVMIKVMGIRNRNEMLNGFINECYPNVFIVQTDTGKRSFTYTDVLIGNILVKLK